MNNDFLTPEQLASMLQVSKKFIDKHIASRRLPGAVKIGRLWRFSRIEVEKRLVTGELLLPEKF